MSGSVTGEIVEANGCQCTSAFDILVERRGIELSTSALDLLSASCASDMSSARASFFAVMLFA